MLSISYYIKYKQIWVGVGATAKNLKEQKGNEPLRQNKTQRLEKHTTLISKIHTFEFQWLYLNLGEIFEAEIFLPVQAHMPSE